MSCQANILFSAGTAHHGTHTCTDTVIGLLSECAALSSLIGPDLPLAPFMPPFLGPLVPMRSASVVPGPRARNLQATSLDTGCVRGQAGIRWG